MLTGTYTIDNIKVTSITITGDLSTAMTVGGTRQLAATITPSNATDKSVTWSTNNSSVASVNASGLVTANSAGTATITCKANDGSGVSASCSITIEDPTSGIEINANNYPDANFRNWLLEQDFGKDGKLTKAEISNIYTIDVNNKNICNLKGIECFTNLGWLRCEDNQLKSLDISKNISLYYLNCTNNQITFLDVSQNKDLNTLYCGKNQITTLDLSQNKKLKDILCHNNKLTLLKVDMTEAEIEPSDPCRLNFHHNKLESIDLSKCSNAKWIVANNNNLTSLDVLSNVNLSILRIQGNQIKGSAMDALINSLPQQEYATFYVYNASEGNEGNVCTKNQAESAKAKGWTPRYYNGTEWVEYEGSDEDSSDINTLLMDKNADNPIYNLSGQRLIAPKKGINIIGGKMVVIK